jgi:hypothetical protein
MYRQTDTFDHARHVTAHADEEDACVVCHTDRAAAKSRAESKSCDSCHEPVAEELTRVRVEGTYPPGVAPGYRLALHSLCIDCHLDHEESEGVTEPALSRCTTCHRQSFEDEKELRIRSGWPSPTAPPPAAVRAPAADPSVLCQATPGS